MGIPIPPLTHSRQTSLMGHGALSSSPQMWLQNTSHIQNQFTGIGMQNKNRFVTPDLAQTPHLKTWALLTFFNHPVNVCFYSYAYSSCHCTKTGATGPGSRALRGCQAGFHNRMPSCQAQTVSPGLLMPRCENAHCS